MAVMSSLPEEKRALRAVVRARRLEAARLVMDAPAALAEGVLRSVRMPPQAVVAGYLPIGDEIDVSLLLRRLRDRGHDISLPLVVETGAPLVFRRWREEDPLADGPFGTRQPLVSSPTVLPDVVILPMLAFDRRGYRLGYGGGFYDRTLAVLRQRRKVLAVGVAYAAQEVPAVPCDRHDQALDWIVTDRETIKPGSSA
jgi:5-formyltetrahydrofolate cyclo-ligase